MIRLGEPERKSDDEFICPYQVDGVGDSNVRWAHGLDAIQALTMAIEGIRKILEKSEEALTWLGGADGEHGVPFMTPHYLREDALRRIERIVNEEAVLFFETERKKRDNITER
jgi:hypothetical protein